MDVLSYLEPVSTSYMTVNSIIAAEGTRARAGCVGTQTRVHGLTWLLNELGPRHPRD